MRILFDKNVPIGVRRLLAGHEVRTFYDMQWDPQLENGALLKAAEEAGSDAMVTSDQNIKYQQILSGRRLAILVLGSNIWPIVREYADAIKAEADETTPGSFAFIEMPVPRKPRKS